MSGGELFHRRDELSQVLLQQLERLIRNGLPHHPVLSTVGQTFKLSDSSGPIGMREIERLYFRCAS
jgi:hypothetical protein